MVFDRSLFHALRIISRFREAPGGHEMLLLCSLMTWSPKQGQWIVKMVRQSRTSENHMAHVGGHRVEVDVEKQPSEGEVLIFTIGGGFVVRGSMLEVAQRLASEEWPTFELAEQGDKIIIRSSQVVALRGGTKSRKVSIGFVPRESS